MTFEKLIRGIKYIKKEGDFNIPVSGLQYDSRKNCKDKVFFCLKGDVFDSHDFIDKVLEEGATGVFVEKWMDLAKGYPIIQVDDCRVAMAKCANVFYDSPSSKMNLIGVTGTNGKTTVSYLIHKVFSQDNLSGGLIGTVKCMAGKEVLPIDRTTPESIDLQEIFHRMGGRGIKNCVMEVSSHAVSMKRINGTVFKAMVFTNLSQDHLDFHKDMKSYFYVKKALFNKNNQVDVINADDKYGAKLIKDSNNVVTYGINSNADYKATDIYASNKGISFKLICPKGEIRINSSLGGLFNVYNCLAAATAANVVGFNLGRIKRGIESLDLVPGRMQFVQRKPFNVIVDYAHTPDGLENLLKSARNFTKGRLITVFGCGGDRDRGKRPKMGHIAVTNSDFSIVTSDNPRSEDPQRIINEIVIGLDNQAYWVEEDRKKAIMKALMIAKESDSVIIAGKGHEAYQEIKGIRHSFDDVVITKEILGRK